VSSSVAFNDGSTATLSNGRAAPFDRFWSWRPVSRDVGPKRTILGTDRRVAFRFTRTRGAYFEIRDIPASSADICDRLKLHLEDGGTCTVTVGDGTNGPYTAALFPGTEVVILTQDERKQRLTVQLTLMNTAGTAMKCSYPT
jgi:hypothetical protein